MKKPSNIVYGVEESPPAGITLLSGLQHVALISVILVFPLLVASEAGLSPKESLDLLSVSMLVLAACGPLHGRAPKPPPSDAVLTLYRDGAFVEEDVVVDVPAGAGSARLPRPAGVDVGRT